MCIRDSPRAVPSGPAGPGRTSRSRRRAPRPSPPQAAVPGWRRAPPKTVLYVSHDRELLARTATHGASLEPTPAGATVWVHGGGFATFAQARRDRMTRLEELGRRWDEEHARLRELVTSLKVKAAYNDGLASRYQAAQTRLRKFEEAGPPQVVAREQDVLVRLIGGRTAKRAVVAHHLELTGLMRPFDLEVWFGERVAVLG